MTNRKSYLLIFTATPKDNNTGGSILNIRKLHHLAPNVYAHQIVITDGYTTLDEQTCKGITKVSWGSRLENIQPLMAVHENGGSIFHPANMAMKFPALKEYGGVNHLRKEMDNAVRYGGLAT